MSNDMRTYSDQTFEDIKHTTDEGQEYWFARELQHVLEYTEWRNFSNIIDKAKTACGNSGNEIDYHFVNLNKMIKLAKGAKREVEVRQTIKELGGTMPENLLTPEKSIQQIDKEQRKALDEKK